MKSEQYTVLDIETYPNPNMIDRLPDPVVKYGNTKDIGKRAIKDLEAKEKQVDSMALSPLYGKIACCGYYDSSSNGRGVIFGDIDEKVLIENIFEMFLIPNNDNPSPKICTWNGANFDIPFIYKSAMMYDIKITYPLSYWTKRYSTEIHADLMQIWSGWNSMQYAKLNDVASAILGDVKDDFDVTTIAEKMKTAEGRKEIENYCMQDVMLTKRLLDKFTGYLF